MGEHVNVIVKSVGADEDDDVLHNADEHGDEDGGGNKFPDLDYMVGEIDRALNVNSDDGKDLKVQAKDDENKGKSKWGKMRGKKRTLQVDKLWTERMKKRYEQYGPGGHRINARY